MIKVLVIGFRRPPLQRSIYVAVVEFERDELGSVEQAFQAKRGVQLKRGFLFLNGVYPQISFWLNTFSEAPS